MNVIFMCQLLMIVMDYLEMLPFLQTYIYIDSWKFMFFFFFSGGCKQSRNDGRLGYRLNFMESRSVCLFSWLAG